MKKYRVFLQGNNFLLYLNDIPTKCGFSTTRYVEANSWEEAERLSVELVRNDSELRQVVLNRQDESPIIFVDEIDELDSFEGIMEVPGKGYSFYPEGDLDIKDRRQLT